MSDRIKPFDNLCNFIGTDEEESIRDIMDKFKDLAEYLDGKLSDTRCKALAFTALEESLLWSKNAVIRG